MNKAKLCWVATNPYDPNHIVFKWTDQDGSGEWFESDDESDYVTYQQYVLIPVE